MEEEYEEIRNTDAVIEKSRDFFQRSLDYLVIGNHEITYNENNKFHTLTLNEFLKKCDKRFTLGFNKEVAENLYKNFAIPIPIKLKEIKDSLQNDFREIVREIVRMDNYLKVYEKKIAKLNVEIELERKRNQELNNKINELDKQGLHDRVNIIWDLMGDDLKKKDIDIRKHFDEGVVENIAETHNIKLDRKEEAIPIVTTPVIEDASGDVSKLHGEVIVMMKKEGAYPLHKGETLDLVSHYKSIWNMKSFKYSLSDEDMPEFLEHVELYQDKPDEYFDKLDNVERLW